MVTSQQQNGKITSEKIAVIIPAAGSGSRMKTSTPKQFYPLNETPVLIHAIAPFLLENTITEIVIVAATEYIDKTREICKKAFPEEDRLQFVTGGTTRQDSVFAGVQAAQADLLMVHDAARPMVTSEIINRCCAALKKGFAFITAVPVVDTIKLGENGKVDTTIDRSNLFRAQTPQGAPKTILLNAFQKFQKETFTDESALLERAGIPVHLIEGEETNLKITRKEDLKLAEHLLNEKASQAVKSISSTPHTGPRIGHGFDTHRLISGRKLILGGVTIPFEKGLDGHSDADVLTHALCDALLGAACEGDIGKNFPNTDSAFKDISSITLLADVVKKINAKGLRLENADITMVCQTPKIAPHIEMMKLNICKTWENLPHWPTPDRLNIKATTEEKLGYTGRGEGMSCHAVALLLPTHTSTL